MHISRDNGGFEFCDWGSMVNTIEEYRKEASRIWAVWIHNIGKRGEIVDYKERAKYNKYYIQDVIWKDLDHPRRKPQVLSIPISVVCGNGTCEWIQEQAGVEKLTFPWKIPDCYRYSKKFERPSTDERYMSDDGKVRAGHETGGRHFHLIRIDGQREATYDAMLLGCLHTTMGEMGILQELKDRSVSNKDLWRYRD